MYSSLKTLFDSMSSYLNNFIVMESPNGNEVQIMYTVFQYDLIDKDLDFDEEYYTHIIENFKMILSKECMDVVKDNPIARVIVAIGKTIMNKEPSVIENQLVFTKDRVETILYR